jgi:hypothetical protein
MNGKPLIPIALQCRTKEADYLVSQIGFIESLERIAKASFPDIAQLSARQWVTQDLRVSGLLDVLVFRTNMDWCLVRHTPEA